MTADLFTPADLAGALFSPCRTYRYALWRTWTVSNDAPLVVVGLNPSTADERTDDPTIRRCIGFAKDWGFTGLLMLNLFALRSTDPDALLGCPLPAIVGADNDQELERWAKGRTVLCAWGAWCATTSLVARPQAVTQLLAGVARELVCLGRTKAGAPRHPLYVPRVQRPEPFGGPA